MKTYTIEASQVIMYTVKVKAKSKKQAEEKFFSGEVECGWDNVTDSGELQMDSIK